MFIFETHPHLEKHWHPNNSKKFQTVPTKSNYVAIWTDSNCNHVWESRVSNITRSSKEISCPYCTNRKVLTGYNDLATTHPEIAAQWHPNLNLPTSPQKVIAGGRQNIWWQCDKGHEWEATLINRKKGTNCPQCYKHDIQTIADSPHLLKYWNTKNHTEAKNLSAKSNKKIWWSSKCGHEWESSPKQMLTNPTCPTCKPKLKINHQLYINWHPTKNIAKIEEVYHSPNFSAWWKCNKGHEWETTIATQKHYKTCPYCTNRKILAGFNDLPTTHPEIVSQWHPTLNININPEKLTYGSKTKVWWVCAKNHEWETTVNKRTQGQNCPICQNQQIIIGKNDFLTTHPNLQKEIHPKYKNIPLPYSYGSEQKLSWVCEQNHEWETQIRYRTKTQTGCPKCNQSSGEKEIQQYLKTLNIPIETNNRQIIKPQELDIYIPAKRIAIEYNGIYWHTETAGKTQNYHYNKWLACKNQNIQLIQIWEDDWNRNPELIKRMIAHKIGANTEPKIYARKTHVEHLNSDTAKTFLNQNHIQGFTTGTYYLALKEKETKTVLALMVLKKETINSELILNLVRYATSRNVPGGFTKLLKYAEINYKPDMIVSFSDNTISNGELYSTNGFTIDKELPPDYMYVVNNERKHKFGYRLKKFKSDPALKYEEGLTETQLAMLNNLPRIWDAGKIRWIKRK